MKLSIILLGILSLGNLFYETDSEEKQRWILESHYRQSTEEQKAQFPYYIQCGLSNEDFEFLCRVVSAESSENYDGNVAVACVIFNRVDNENFPDTVIDVLTESGQFSTVRQGECNTETTDETRKAVVEAYLNRPLPTNVLYFRADYYFNWGTPYAKIGGNCFSAVN